MKLIVLESRDAAVLAAVHATSFDAPWSAQAFAALLDGPGVFALAAGDEADRPCAIILLRSVAGEAEVLTLAVAPGHRRRGMARDLLDAGLVMAAARGAEAVFLEVAEDNPAALALYQQAGFTVAGRRGAYYARAQGPPADALVLRKDLASPDA